MVAPATAQPSRRRDAPTGAMVATTPLPAPGAAELAAIPPRERRLATHKQLLGARFRFRGDDVALLRIIESAYGGLPSQRFPWPGPDIDLELCLLASEGRQTHGSAGPPPVRVRLAPEAPCAVMDPWNYALVSPRQCRGRVVASRDMLERPYHLRYELLEFAVFILAARCQGLVPLHGACIGRDGAGLLLLGASGAGKSTLVLHALLHGWEVLAEDAVFVHPEHLLATGVPNFLHVHDDALAGVHDRRLRDWIAHSPVIRRRSGAEKREAALAQAPGKPCMAGTPMRLAGIVALSGHCADPPGNCLAPATPEQAAAWLALDQAYAMAQPQWPGFRERALRLPVHVLHRAPSPGSMVDAIARLLH